MTELRITVALSPETQAQLQAFMRQIKCAADALAQWARLVPDTLRQSATSFAGESVPLAWAEPAGDSQADCLADDVSSQQTAQPAAATTPKPSPPAAASSAGRGQDASGPGWTAERKAMLRLLSQRGRSDAEILAAVNAMSGRPFKNTKAIENQRRILGIKNGAALRAVPASPGGGGPKDSAPLPPRITDLATIRIWAAARGITVDTPADLGKVNAKCAELGLPPFLLPAPRSSQPAP